MEHVGPLSATGDVWPHLSSNGRGTSNCSRLARREVTVATSLLRSPPSPERQETKSPAPLSPSSERQETKSPAPLTSPERERQETKSPAPLSPSARPSEEMEKFHGGHHVHALCLLAAAASDDDDDSWVFLHPLRSFDGQALLILRSSADGRRLAAATTVLSDRERIGLGGNRVTLRDLLHRLGWFAISSGSRDDVLLDDRACNTSTSCVVEVIPPRDSMPRLPVQDPNLLSIGHDALHLWFVRAERASPGGSSPHVAWACFEFTGRSLFNLRVAPAYWFSSVVSDFIMCVRAGFYGRLIPLVIDLPRSFYSGLTPLTIDLPRNNVTTMEIIVVTGRTLGSCRCKYNEQINAVEAIPLRDSIPHRPNLNLVFSGTSFPIGGDNDMMGADNERAEGIHTTLLVEEGIVKLDTELPCVSCLTSWCWCNQAIRWLIWRTCTALSGLMLPDTWSWEKTVGSPAVQGRGGCSLSACTVCIEAQHRMIFDRLHGTGSFRWRAEVPPKTLRMESVKKEAWSPEGGGKVEHVLEVVVNMGGLPTMDSFFLPVVGYKTYPGPYNTGIFGLEEENGVKPLSPIEAARLIRQRGPIIGALPVNPPHYFSYQADAKESTEVVQHLQ